MLLRLLVAAFLLAHGAIHAGYLSRRPAPARGAPPWPFSLEGSWALGSTDPAVVRAIAMALVAVTIAGYALGAIGVVGIGPSVLFTAGVVVGSMGSLALLLLFPHGWLIAGVAIDLVLLFVALVQAWSPTSLG